MKPMKVLLKTYFGDPEMFYKTVDKKTGIQRIWSDDIYLDKLPALPFINLQLIEDNRLIDVYAIEQDFIPLRIEKQMDKSDLSYLMIVKPGKKNRTIIEEYAFTGVGLEGVRWTYEY